MFGKQPVKLFSSFYQFTGTVPTRMYVGSWGQLKSKASTDVLLQIYRKNYSAEASDYLISIFTKSKSKAHF